MIEPIATYGTRSMYAVAAPSRPRQPLNPRLWEMERVGESHRLAKLMSKLASLADLQEDWDSYGSEPPTEKALRNALKALSQTWLDLLPLEVVPSVEGGVTFVYMDDERGYAELEFGNDDEVVAAVRSSSGKVDVWDVGLDFGLELVVRRFHRLVGRGA